MNSMPLLTILTLLPLAGAALLFFIPREKTKLVRQFALATALLTLALTGWLWCHYDPANAQMQFAERAAWVPSLGIEFHLGVDALGLLMVLLAAIVIPFAMLASWKISENPKLYFGLLLLLETGLFGTFTALNFFHWFIFWELSLIPAFFLIKLWGGPGRSRAAVQFFVYTMIGSVTMLLSFLAIMAATGIFDFVQLADLARHGDLPSILFAKLGGGLFKTKEALATVLFLGVFLGFAVKVPLIPFHTWLPDAYAEAPTGTSMVLTGVMSKMGVYGFLRILLPIFPDQTRAALTPLLWLAVATIVFSAFAAFAQKDLKRMVAYASINHLGYCLLGIFAVAKLSAPSLNAPLEKTAVLNGVMLQMFNHGLTAAALFYFVGILEQRSGRRSIDDFGGLRKTAPVLCGLMGITLFASLGLPGLNGFIGEFLIFKGVFPLATAAAAVSTIGLMVTAIFILTLIQRVFHGPLPGGTSSTSPNNSGSIDLTRTERFTVIPIIALMFVLGIYPQIVIALTNPTAMQMVQKLSQ